jgi:glycosyltransferase involved in cell wall biosynthesis
MKISVIIPAYNAAAFLPQSLQSVLDQSLQPEEIIVVDDGSTDDTATTAAAFSPRIRVLSIPNSKLGAARNFGVSQAGGEWIAFLDADDVWQEEKLERQASELAKCAEADLCYTGHVPFTMEHGEMAFGDPVAGKLSSEIKNNLYHAFTFLPSSAIVRKTALTRVGGFSADPDIAEDWDLWLRLLHAGCRFAACPECLVYYRVHGGSLTSNKLRTIAKNARVYREQVLTRLTISEKWIASARYKSNDEFDIACILRERGDPGCLGVMTSSIIRWPFADPQRYKVWLHMLLARLKVIRK